MKIIFFGNTEFSNPTLKKCNASLDVVSVVTNPSKKMGRGRRFSDTPVKILADKLRINVIQVENLENKDFVQKLRDLKPDLFVVVAYKILPKSLLSIPTMGQLIYTLLYCQNIEELHQSRDQFLITIKLLEFQHFL